MRRLMCVALLALSLAACGGTSKSSGRSAHPKTPAAGSTSPSPSPQAADSGPKGVALTVTRTEVAYHSPGFAGEAVPVYGALMDAMSKAGRSIDAVAFGTHVQAICYVPGVKGSYDDLYWLTLPGNNAPVWAHAKLFVHPLKPGGSDKPITGKYWTNRLDSALPPCILS